MLVLRKSQLKKPRTPSFRGPLAVVTSPHGLRTLLHLGAKNGHVALVKLWLDSEFDSNIEALIKAEFGAIATNEGPVHLDPRPPASQVRFKFNNKPNHFRAEFGQDSVSRYLFGLGNPVDEPVGFCSHDHTPLVLTTREGHASMKNHCGIK
jgi:hypothetical protein